ncbi:DUF1275 domain-containing protein [Lysobacter sp. HDW10]|uniref:YoaK family protein n=1 Tax=Lysobacter sp. HDW10 TaxID=2714936 RepID=UPI001408E6C0|nr:YoaK family protein [Lysobacter sp. HDW10]QIK80661.1 DUF1275 domain-containing protein [Lysobacter sp. HDW10]
MIARLPRWVWPATWVLAFMAGIINVVGFLGFEHQGITHLTGTTSMLGAAIADANMSGVLHFALLIVAFVLGCAISGFVIQDSKFQLGRRYGVALLFTSSLLFLSVPLLSRGSAWGMYSAACAAGIQNAMVSAFSGAVVRTTHVSGMLTDLGISLGHVLRRLPLDTPRLRLSLTVITGFLCGGIAGALLFRAVRYEALLVPASLSALAAVSYVVFRLRHPRQH